jgi:hypothetical protein
MFASDEEPSDNNGSSGLMTSPAGVGRTSRPDVRRRVRSAASVTSNHAHAERLHWAAASQRVSPSAAELPEDRLSESGKVAVRVARVSRRCVVSMARHHQR